MSSRSPASRHVVAFTERGKAREKTFCGFLVYVLIFRERQRAHEQERERDRDSRADTPPSAEPTEGLHPTAPSSQPKPKAGRSIDYTTGRKSPGEENPVLGWRCKTDHRERA